MIPVDDGTHPFRVDNHSSGCAAVTNLMCLSRTVSHSRDRRNLSHRDLTTIKRPERSMARKSDSSATMATVALRGEEAVRFRALAATRGVSLARLVVQMIEVFEAQAK